MKRDPARLSDEMYDVVVIGGGIYGACVAWDAALRGLSVALVEKGDFGHATSSNSLRLIHGGLRYLQHLDIRRMRRAIRERMIWMRIAPHLVHPLPILVPTYGHWTRGREVLSLALKINDLISFDRNRLKDPEKYIPRGRLISRTECIQLLPGIKEEGLTGGALWYDCQMYNSERLILSILRSASEAGADVANYVEVTGFIREGDHARGVKARDVLRGDEIDIRAKIVINTGGPWIDKVLRLENKNSDHQRVRLLKAMNLVTRSLIKHYAVGLSMRHRNTDMNGAGSNGSRLLFVTPWRNLSLIGTSQVPYNGDPDRLEVTEREIREFLDQINSAFPAASLGREDICFFHAGLVPMGGEERGLTADLATRYRICDHSAHEGLEGLISVVSVKFTEARHVGEELVDRIFDRLGKKPPRSLTRNTPVCGGEIERFDEFLAGEKAKQQESFRPEVIEHLIYNYGAEYSRMIEYFDEDPAASQPVSCASLVLKAEVLHGIREEMAQKLTDVIFRRTELGIAGDPGQDCLATCAGIMGRELGWNEARVHQEINEAKTAFTLARSHA
jgi:glycerol-3-phosphate dehydrogenase